MNLALFDLDNTLLSSDTDVEWLDFLIGQGVLDKSLHGENLEMDRRYRSGKAGALEYVRFYLRFYPRFPIVELVEYRKAFVRQKIESRILPAGQRLLESHRQDLVAIITATNRFLTEPIAELLGVEHLIATEPQLAGGRFTGEAVGVPCMREGKVNRLEEWLNSRRSSLSSFDESWFYSDSINDQPLLERVTHPVAVDPDERLEALARQRGWRVITLRGAPAARGGPRPT
ncbi:MAG TPA: HAD family hydrolase [Burkholderiales bacterium]|nr:HAD family hydrolase [Burkholderiales bacterium]